MLIKKSNPMYSIMNYICSLSVLLFVSPCTGEIVSDSQKTASTVDWFIMDMDRVYRKNPTQNLTSLTTAQQKELKKLLSKYDLLREGTKKSYPYIGERANFIIQSHGEYYWLGMIYNKTDVTDSVFNEKLLSLTRVTFLTAEEAAYIDKAQITIKIPVLNIYFGKPSIIARYPNGSELRWGGIFRAYTRYFESQRLYADLDAFLHKHQFRWDDTENPNRIISNDTSAGN